MILDQVFKALGCSWSYPCKQLFLLNLVLFLCSHNLQKVPLLSWSPGMFCAVKNHTGLFPYNKTKDGVIFYPIKSKCALDSKGALLNCTLSKWMEKNREDPKCSPFAVQKFPKCVLPDSKLVYEATEGYTTVVTFNTVCSRASFVRLQDALYFIGSAVAYLTCVPLGDLIGRKPIILQMCICLVVLNTITALSPSVELLITCRFLSGMCYATITGLVSALMYELNTPQRRMAVAVFGQLATSYAQMLLGLTSYAIPHWRYWVGFEAVLALAFALLLAALPESIRWLLIIYKNDPNLNADCEIKARKIVKSVLKSRIKSRFPPKNLTELTAIDETLGFKGTLEVGSFATIDYKESFEAKRSSSIIHSDDVNFARTSLEPPVTGKLRSNSRQVSFKSRMKDAKHIKANAFLHPDSDDLGISTTLSGESQQNIHVKSKMTPILWRCLFVMMFLRTVVNVIYYALALSSNVLFAGTRHWNIFYLGLIELPVGPICYLLNKKAPRRVGISLMFLLTGIPFLIMGIWNFLQKPLPVAARYVFFLLGKSTATATVLMINLYMAEVFPTTVRTTFSGYCSGVARTCSIFSTLAPSLFRKYNAELVTVLSGIALTCAGLVWILPETKDRKLPQTPSDLETIHLETKSLVETLRSARTSYSNKMVRGVTNDGIGGAGGLGESSVVGDWGTDTALPPVSYYTPGGGSAQNRTKTKGKKLTKQQLGVIKE